MAGAQVITTMLCLLPIQQHSLTLKFSVEMCVQQALYHAVPCGLSAPRGALSVGSSAAAAPDSECELVPVQQSTRPKMQ